jgi:hypothetical protein
MPQVRRQDWQAALYVLAGAIPLDQSLHGESVTKIVQTRATTGIHSPQSNLPRQGIEHTMDLAFVQPVSVLIHKQVCLRSQAEAVVSAFQVIG